MIGPMIRSVFAVSAALALALLLVIGVEALSSALHPLPEGLDPADPAVICEHVARYPPALLLGAGALWGLTTFLSAWTATRLGAARHPAHGVLVGSVLLALAVLNMSMLPYPAWFWALNLVAFPAGCWLGVRLVRPRPAVA